jgi:hypothetical protein
MFDPAPSEILVDEQPEAVRAAIELGMGIGRRERHARPE